MRNIRKIKLLFLTIGIILVAGCQKLENNQDKSLLVEQTESMLDEKSKEKYSTI